MGRAPSTYPAWYAAARLAAVSAFAEAGCTDVALVQIGDESQSDFRRFAESELLPALRKS